MKNRICSLLLLFLALPLCAQKTTRQPLTPLPPETAGVVACDSQTAPRLAHKLGTVLPSHPVGVTPDLLSDDPELYYTFPHINNYAWKRCVETGSQADQTMIDYCAREQAAHPTVLACIESSYPETATTIPEHCFAVQLTVLSYGGYPTDAIPGDTWPYCDPGLNGDYYCPKD